MVWLTLYKCIFVYADNRVNDLRFISALAEPGISGSLNADDRVSIIIVCYNDEGYVRKLTGDIAPRFHVIDITEVSTGYDNIWLMMVAKGFKLVDRISNVYYLQLLMRLDGFSEPVPGDGMHISNEGS